jgi:hypothetical protein
MNAMPTPTAHIASNDRQDAVLGFMSMDSHNNLTAQIQGAQS